MRRTVTICLALFICSALIGCTTTCSSCDCGHVAAEVASRTGLVLNAQACAGEVFLPNGARLEHLTEDEAVLIALWNNAALQEVLIDIGIARGDLIQAGLLPNPEFAYFFNAPDKPLKYALEFPLEALWLRPIRVAAAGREADRVCERLTQAALDLIRDARQAYADVLLAKGRLKVADDAVRIRGEIARLANARLQAGDISEQEAATARVDALQATQDRTRIEYDVTIAEERLRNVLGVALIRNPMNIVEGPQPKSGPLDVDSLVTEATATRPDARAAEQAAAAAAERVRLANLIWYRVFGILDATSGRNTGHEFSPAVRVTLPIFNWNQGNIARAEAEHERAERQRITVRNQIILDVRQAHSRYTQARAEMDVLVRQVQPEVEAGIRRAEAGYREGNAPYVIVLESTRQLLDSRIRQIQLEVELRRAWAELERSVGRHLDNSTTSQTNTP